MSEKRRSNDKGLASFVSSGSVGLTLVTAIIVGAIGWGVLETTVADQGQKIKDAKTIQVAQNTRNREARSEQNTRIRSLEQGQAVIKEKLRAMHAAQKRAADRAENGQKLVLEQLRRLKRD